MPGNIQGLSHRRGRTGPAHEHMGCLSTDRALLLAANDASLEPRHYGENLVCVLRVHPGEELGEETNVAKKSRARQRDPLTPCPSLGNL